MSAITALKAANEQGIPIYTIDQSNAASLNPIQTDPDDLQDMRNAVAAGLRVTTPKKDIHVDNFTGLGYILEDPVTGAAAYLISGGRNGNDSPAPETSFVLPRVPATPIIGLMAGSVLRSAGATLIAENGVFAGISFSGAVGGAIGGAAGGALLGQALIAILVILILITAITYAIDTLYPLRPRTFAKFRTTAQALWDFGHKLIRETRESPGKVPPYGDGVYLADLYDPTWPYVVSSGI